MDTVLLNVGKHNRIAFDCGSEPLNHYLATIANQHLKNDNSRTFILEDEADSSGIAGYYTLTMVSLEMDSFAGKLKKKHQSASAAGLIARLAIDKRYQGNGLGSWLLVDALRKLVLASDYVAFPVIIVDAKDSAKDFYLNYGFQAFQDTENKLFITVSDVRASFD